MPGGRGGRRNGKPGKTYTNRTDLNGHQPIRTVPNQTYGDAGQQQAAQRAIPLPTQTPPPTAPPPGLTDPTERPAEPITHGSPTGPGAGTEALQSGFSADDNLEATIRGLYQRFPNSDLASLVAQLTAKRT